LGRREIQDRNQERGARGCSEKEWQDNWETRLDINNILIKMTIKKEQQTKMLETAKPIIRWLNENCHPHCEIRVSQNSVELVEGVAMELTDEFLKD